MVQINLHVYICISLNAYPNSLAFTKRVYRISAYNEKMYHKTNFSIIRIKSLSVELKKLIMEIYDRIERHLCHFLVLIFLFFFFIYISFFLLCSDKIFYNNGERYVKD